MSSPEPGREFRYTSPDPYGVGPQALPPGTHVTVRELVPADVQGAHTDTEDAVVVEWQQPDVGYTDGQPVIVHVPRATSFGAQEFTDLFEAV